MTVHKKSGTVIGSIEYAWYLIDRSDEGWDDYAEYESQDFQSRYGLNEDDAAIIWLVIQSRIDDRRMFGSLTEEEELIVPEVIREAQHQSFDGWTVAQRLVIEAFLSDITWGINNLGKKE